MQNGAQDGGAGNSRLRRSRLTLRVKDEAAEQRRPRGTHNGLVGAELAGLEFGPPTARRRQCKRSGPLQTAAFRSLYLAPQATTFSHVYTFGSAGAAQKGTQPKEQRRIRPEDNWIQTADAFERRPRRLQSVRPRVARRRRCSIDKTFMGAEEVAGAVAGLLAAKASLHISLGANKPPLCVSLTRTHSDKLNFRQKRAPKARANSSAPII